MREVLHLSFSAKANHLSTHFFNAQEAYFTFGDTVSPVDHDITFRSGLATDGVTETFTPRCLLWDLKSGFGSLKKYNALYEDNPDAQYTSDVVRIEQPRLPTSAYIKHLDENSPHIPKLSTSSTLYWSDYCNIFHHPRSLLQLSNWEYDPVKFPKGRARGSALNPDVTSTQAIHPSNVREFKGYNVGVDEFHDKVNGDNAGEEALEVHFRGLLEECDLISGVNLVTEVDSAWGGFASEALSELRDAYIPKTPVFVWALEDYTVMNRAEQYSRIQTIDALVPLSTLYIPICIGSNAEVLARFFDRPVAFDYKSNWHNTGLANAAFESLTLPTRLREPGLRVSMDTLASQISSFGTRNIVDGLELAFSHGKLQIGGTNIVYNGYQNKFDQLRSRMRSRHTFSQFSIVRDPNGSPESMEKVWTEYSKPDDVISEGGTTDKRLVTLGYPRPPSYPDYLEDRDILYASLYSSSSTKYQLADMKEFVSRYVRTDEREELKDDLENLSAQYEFEWSNANSENDEDY